MEILRMDTHMHLPISDPSQIGEARRVVTKLATDVGMDSVDTGKLAIIATEATTNIIKHGQAGTLLVSPLRAGTHIGLEILALDKGRGMHDVVCCLQDGYSTAGSPGTGLGAIVRLSTLFDIYSAAGAGTVVLSRFWAGNRGPPPAGPCEFGGISVAMRGEKICGDAWACGQTADRAVVMVADGLGHGPLAAVAAQGAVRVFHDHAERAPTEVLDIAHRALRGTRGAAAAILEAIPSTRAVRYAGVGNISGSIAMPGSTKTMMFQNGTLGVEIRRVMGFPYSWPTGAVLIVYSDGISTRWSIQGYPGLLARHASVIAGVLYRDFSRTRDDATIVVAREVGTSQ